MYRLNLNLVASISLYREPKLSFTELVYELASTTLDFLASNRELKHHTTILAVLFLHFGRGHFVDTATPRAFDLLRSCNKLEHGSALVAYQVALRHRWYPLCNAQLSVWQVHKQMHIARCDLITRRAHRLAEFFFQ